jgi:cytochrome c553
MAMALLYAYLLLLPALAAADRFAGASACAACHPAQFEKQRNSRHAASLARVTESSLAEKLIGQTVREKSGAAGRGALVRCSRMGVRGRRARHHAGRQDWESIL